MFVKLFNQILDSSLAEDRRLRHFFTDLLLCSDADGNVIMTKAAIAHRIRADLKEVEWGIRELSKPDEESRTSEFDGRRIVPLEGHGYGWRIVNYRLYRDLKSAAEMRAATADRVKRFRERKKIEPVGVDTAPKKKRVAKEDQPLKSPLPGEEQFVRDLEEGRVDKDGVKLRGAEEVESVRETLGMEVPRGTSSGTRELSPEEAAEHERLAMGIE